MLAYLEAENAYTRRRARAPRAAARRAVRRDRGAGAGDRHHRADPPRRHEYFTRTRRGTPVRRALPRPAGDAGAARPDGGTGRARRRGRRARRERARRRTRLLRGRRPRREPDQRVAAYSTDTSGGERYELRFRDRADGRRRRRNRIRTTSCPTSTTAWRGRTTARPSSTPGPTTPCARGRSGATRSARPPTTTCSCSRRTTSASTSASAARAAGASS